MVRHFKNEAGYVVVLERGDELITSLTDFATQNNLQNLWLQSGLGGSMEATLGLYDLESQQYKWTHYKGMHEIASLQGNMTILDGKPFWHIHATIGDQELKAIAGHVKEMIIGLTCEMFITILNTPMVRSQDGQTGLKLLSSTDPNHEQS